jgi:hypothetical protein
MRQPGTISHRRHGFHRKNYLAEMRNPKRLGGAARLLLAQSSAGLQQPGGGLRKPDHPPSHRPGRARRRRPRRPVQVAVHSGSPASRILRPPRGCIIIHPRSHRQAPTRRSIRCARLRPMRSATARSVGSPQAEGRVDQGRQPCPPDPLGTWSRHGCPWRLTLVALGFSASAAIGDLCGCDRIGPLLRNV